MKLTYLQINKYLVYFVLIILLFNISTFTMGLAILITFISGLLYLFSSKGPKSYKTSIDIYIIALLIIIFLLNAIRALFFGEYQYLNLKEIIKYYGGYLLIILAYPIAEILNNEKFVFLDKINKIGIIFVTLKFFSWIIYNFFHIDMGFTLLGGRIAWTRWIGNYSFSRISGTFLDGFLFAYAIASIFSINTKKSSKIKYTFQIILLLIYSYFVFQSRVQLLFYFGSFLVCLIYWMFIKKNNFLSVAITFILVISLIYIFRNDIIVFLNTFSTTSDYANSTITRIQEYTFFPMLWNKNKLLGFGFALDEMGYYMGYNMYRSDIGLLMQLYQFGIIGFIISVFPFFIGTYKSLKLAIKKYDFFFIFLLIFNTYILISSTSYDIYMYNLLPVLPIYVGLILSNNKVS